MFFDILSLVVLNDEWEDKRGKKRKKKGSVTAFSIVDILWGIDVCRTMPT